MNEVISISTERIIFHIDVNSAFLSWEAAYRLEHRMDTIDLRTIPSAVGGDKEKRHGIILAKSEPAKRYGVKTAETLNDALKKCPDLVIVPPRFELYYKCSKAFINILLEYSPNVEPYSIDEAFVDMTNSTSLFGSPVVVANLIKDRIRQELGFTVNIGVAHNKLLAKMASDFKKPDLVHTLFEHEISTKMWPLPVNELFFVGRATTRKLRNLGIYTIGDLAQSDLSIIKSHLGKHGELIYNYANGIDTSPVTTEVPANKGYGNSTTIDHDVTDANEAKKILLSLCETVCSRIRKDSVLVSVVSVSIKNCFLASESHQKTLLSATNVASELHRHACELFDSFWDGTPIRQLGVHTSHITQEGNQQLNLFDMDLFIRQGNLEKTIDQIRGKFGENSIQRASFLSGNHSHMAGGTRKEHMNPDKDDIL